MTDGPFETRVECGSYDLQQTYTCQTAAPQGESCCERANGWGTCCQVGCCTCIDDNLLNMRVHVTGRRWLRPAIDRTNRDAQGKETPLRSNVPLRVPRFVHFERAPCFDNFANEFFDADVCSCHPAPRSVILGEHDPTCEHGETPGETMNGRFPDCSAYTGHKYAGREWLWCRTVTEHDESLVRLSSGPPFPAVFERNSEPSMDYFPCAPNGLTWCTQEAPDSPCREPWCDSSLCYYNDSTSRAIWQTVGMDWGAGDPGQRPHITGDAFVSDPAMLDLKNAVLDKVVTVAFPDGSALGVRFDQLDQPDARVPDMSQWSRGYNSAGGVTACEDLIVAASLSDSYYVHTHEPANVDLVITSVSVVLHLVPYRMDVKSHPFDDDEPETLPYSRVWIKAECRARARQAGGECFLLPSSQVPPIIFKDTEGRQLAEVPKVVEWWGFLGHSSDPAIANIETAHEPWAFSDCCGLAEDLSAVVIPGWPVMSGTHPSSPNQLYVGQVRPDFKNTIWESFCNAP